MPKLRTFDGVMIIVIMSLFTISSISAINDFTLDDDEGMNLLKADSLNRGYHLYDEIWSDQPPIYTYMIAAVLDMSGNNALAARLLSVVFAFLILICFSCISYIASKNIYAIILSPILLIITPKFTFLSHSIMIDMPAICFYYISIFLFVLYIKNHPTNSKRSYTYISSSSLAFGTALCIKPVMAQVGLVIFVFFIFSIWHFSSYKIIARYLFLYFIFIILPISISIFIFGTSFINQVLGTYLSITGEYFGYHSIISNITQIIHYISRTHISIYIIFIFSLIGLLFIIKQKKANIFVSFIFSIFIINLFAVILQTPFRPRYVALIILPLSMIALVSICHIIDYIRKKSNLTISSLIIVLIAVLSLVSLRGLGVVGSAQVRSVRSRSHSNDHSVHIAR